jgi:hypothetical protein
LAGSLRVRRGCSEKYSGDQEQSRRQQKQLVRFHGSPSSLGIPTGLISDEFRILRGLSEIRPILYNTPEHCCERLQTLI